LAAHRASVAPASTIETAPLEFFMSGAGAGGISRKRWIRTSPIIPTPQLKGCVPEQGAECSPKILRTCGDEPEALQHDRSGEGHRSASRDTSTLDQNRQDLAAARSTSSQQGREALDRCSEEPNSYTARHLQIRAKKQIRRRKWLKRVKYSRIRNSSRHDRRGCVKAILLD
jgi:hypothetical protein